MLEVEIRPSLRMVNTIAQIERFCGGWTRFANNELLCSEAKVVAARVEALAAIVELDESVSPQSRFYLRDVIEQLKELDTEHSLYTALRNHPQLANIALAHQLPASFQSYDFAHLQAVIHSAAQAAPEFRTSATKLHCARGDMIFPTTAAFLIETRLQDILQWSSNELEHGEIHPLLIIGTSYLLLLQLAPFAHFNHASALIFIWQQLLNAKYEFVRFYHPARIFVAEYDAYCNSLRNAEKSVGENWNTLASWLEFFLHALEQCCNHLSVRANGAAVQSRLSAVQQNIIEVVRTHGSASRELIVSSTGISPSTVKYNLSLLSSVGVLKRSGGGRTTRYSFQ